MENNDIRWQQRFNNFSKALQQLQEFVEKGSHLNKMEAQGLIKAFEYTFELSWNVMKDYLESQATEVMRGSRDAFRLAFNRGLIKDGELWMKMIESRIKTSHTYDEKEAAAVVSDIIGVYSGLFMDFHKTMKGLIDEHEIRP